MGIFDNVRGAWHPDKKAEDPPTAKAEAAERMQIVAAAERRENGDDSSLQGMTPEEVEKIVAESSDPAEAKMMAVDLRCEKRMADEPSPTKPAANAGGVNSRASVGLSFDHGDGFRERAIDALRARINPDHMPTMGADLAGCTVGGIAAAFCHSHGIRFQGGDKGALKAAMSGTHSTSDFPLIFEGVIGREMAMAYEPDGPSALSGKPRVGCYRLPTADTSASLYRAGTGKGS